MLKVKQKIRTLVNDKTGSTSNRNSIVQSNYIFQVTRKQNGKTTLKTKYRLSSDT